MISSILFAVLQLFGGLAIFIYGMSLMSQALQKLAGDRLRELLQRMTRNRVASFLGGTSLSFLVHSSAATVMIVGFLGAGLLTFTRSIPIMLGANVGTTLSMQLISFKIGQYCFLALGVGLLLSKLSQRTLVKNLGMTAFGFGLLFLGMNVMSDALSPLKDIETLRNSGFFEGFVAWTSARTIVGLIVGVLIWSAFTGLIQSSGAAIAIGFALCDQGFYKDLSDVYPCLLGAHIGTCVTAALGSLGTNYRAKRLALAHLIFNIFSTVLAALMLGLYESLMPATSDSLIRQAANANTLVQLIAALMLLPLARPYARLIKTISWFQKDSEGKSFLSDKHLDTPETALYAALRELRRMAQIERRMVKQAMNSLFELNPAELIVVRNRCSALTSLEAEQKAYLRKIAERELSRRQALLVQYLGACLSDLGRVTRDLQSLGDLVDDKIRRDIWFDPPEIEGLFKLYGLLDVILKRVVKLLKPFSNSDQDLENLNAAQNAYLAESRRLSEHLNQRLLAGDIDPKVGVFYNAFLRNFDEIAQRFDEIARIEAEPLFYLKRHKLALTSPRRLSSSSESERKRFGEGKTLKQVVKELRATKAANLEQTAADRPAPADVTSVSQSSQS